MIYKVINKCCCIYLYCSLSSDLFSYLLQFSVSLAVVQLLLSYSDVCEVPLLPRSEKDIVFLITVYLYADAATLMGVGVVCCHGNTVYTTSFIYNYYYSETHQ